MKKISIYLLCLSAVLFSACDRKSDLNIDGKSTDVRLSEALAAYQQKLVDAPYGWVLTEYTTGSAINGGVTRTGAKAIFSYYMKFDKDNKVSMISDFSTSMATTFNTSSFQVKAVQRPTLVFDTYSYVHVPCDPDAAISNGPFGKGFGWGTDFEFSFADNVGATDLGDTIHLKGNLNGSNAVLIKATQEDQTNYTNNGFGALTAFNKILTYFKRITIGGTVVEITPGIGGRTFNLKYAGHPDIINVSCRFNAHDIIFGEPITIGSETVQSLNDLTWNAGAGMVSATINGTTATTISAAIAPLIPDPDIAETFYDIGYSNPWVAYAGFHVNGVDDAYNIQKLSYPGGTFEFFVFYPGMAQVGPNTFYDFLSPLFSGLAKTSYPYLEAGGISYTTIQNGRLVFSMLDFGDPVVNPNDLLYTNLIFDTGQTIPRYPPRSFGFYLVLMEDGVTYDMVTAGDATGWIHWQHL